MALTADEQALCDRIAAEVVSAMPDAAEIARRTNYTMARQLTVAYFSFAATIVITLFIDQHLPRWPLYIAAFFLFAAAGFWNRKADEFRRENGDPHLIAQREHRLSVRMVVLVPVVIVLVAAFVMAGYSTAMLRAPLTIVFLLWLGDLFGLMRSQGAERAAQRTATDNLHHR